MAGGKETARQKMINIMYLVLLAMLALNVSDKILEAFANINDSLETSISNVDKSVDQIVRAYEGSKTKDQAKLDKAKLAQSYTKELSSYIESLKDKFKKQGGWDPEKGLKGDYEEASSMDIGQNIMVKAGEKHNEGEVLKNKINDTRNKLLALFTKPEDKKQIVAINALVANDPLKAKGDAKTWQEINFGEGVPLTAMKTVLTKIQNDAKNAEAEAVKILLSDAPPVTLDRFSAVAVAPTSVVTQGQPYTAEVFLTASDSKSSPDITVNGGRLTTKDGKGIYTGSTGSVGVFKWVGTVRVKNNNTGKIDEYKTPEQTYQVVKPSATISPDKMNVIYAGIPNPFSVSAPGYANVSASISGGSMSGSDGKYMVNVGGSMVGKEVSISVVANSGGKSIPMGSQKFRVKGIPTPRAQVGGKSGGNISAAQLKSESGIQAELPDFLFDVKFKILGYSITVIKPKSDPISVSGSGETFAGSARTAMNAITPGSIVIFSGIITQGPDGRQKVLDPISFTAK